MTIDTRVGPPADSERLASAAQAFLDTGLTAEARRAAAKERSQQWYR